MSKKRVQKARIILTINTPSLIRPVTVGTGIPPDPVLSHPRTVTADREFPPAKNLTFRVGHPALKTLLLFNCFQNYNTGERDMSIPQPFFHEMHL